MISFDSCCCHVFVCHLRALCFETASPIGMCLCAQNEVLSLRQSAGSPAGSSPGTGQRAEQEKEEFMRSKVGPTLGRRALRMTCLVTGTGVNILA